MNTPASAVRPSLLRRSRTAAVLVICLLAFLPQTARSAAANPDFPLYPSIRDNVRFWKDVYTKHSLRTSVIHDKNDLSIIYEVVSLLDDRLPGAKQYNKDLLDRKKARYAAILKKLSRSAPATSEERRIAALFSGRNPARRMALAAESIRTQTGQKERFAEGVVRSGAYMAAIKQIFRSYNLPEDLAYLPHVESSFNTKAYSKLGASGMWQFTYSTGKNYLWIDQAVDQRGDPIAAAHAAAKYLRNSYNQLGTWPLSLTSYNYGTAGMKRALQEKGSYERIFREYDKGHFKFASRNFYSEFLAALESAKEMERNPSIRLDRPVPTRTVTLKNKTGIHQICKRFGVSSKTLESINPALRPSVFSGQQHIPKGYVLHLPAPAGKAQPAIAASRTAAAGQAGHTAHRVKKGDTLSALARKYGVSPVALTKANGIDNGVIRIDQVLQIPKPPVKIASRVTISPTPSAIKKIRKDTGGVSGKPTAGLNVYKSTIHNGKQYGKIQVQPGESLQLLSQWTATPPTVLQQLNRLAEQGTVHPGRHLVLVFDKVSIGNFQKRRLQFHEKGGKDKLSAGSSADGKGDRVASSGRERETPHRLPL
jgi:membrane-bound lytic murein transglycosylase D